MCAELCIPFGNSLLAPPFVLPGFLSLAGYFQQPQGETVTDASLLCPRARRACGVGVHNIWLSPWRQQLGGGGVLNLITPE